VATFFGLLDYCSFDQWNKHVTLFCIARSINPPIEGLERQPPSRSGHRIGGTDSKDMFNLCRRGR